MPHWTWRDGEVPPGPTVLIDIDGVISNASGRQHFLDGATKSWQDFFKASKSDQPLAPGIALLDIIDGQTLVTLLTARPESILAETVDWLHEHHVRWDLLIMRGRSDYMASPDMKRLAVEELRYASFKPVLALDDDQRNITMYEEEAIPALYIHSGYYEA